MRTVYRYERSSVVCVSVGHAREPCKNGWTDRHVDSRVHSGGPKEKHVLYGFQIPRRREKRLRVLWFTGKHWGSVLRQFTQQKSITATTKLWPTGCNAPDWSVSRYIFREKSAAPAMRPFVKIHWPLVNSCSLWSLLLSLRPHTATWSAVSIKIDRSVFVVEQ